MGISTNPGSPEFLDFYIEGESQGWVAVGFSETQNMVGSKLDYCWNLIEGLFPPPLSPSLSLSLPLPPPSPGSLMLTWWAAT